jgi:hypothetical protein
MDPKKIKHDDFVNKVNDTSKDAQQKIVLSGYIGKSPSATSIRIYPEASLGSYYEVNAADIIHQQPMADDGSGLGGSILWVKSDAVISHGDDSYHFDAKNNYFKGDITNAYPGPAGTKLSLLIPCGGRPTTSYTCTDPGPGGRPTTSYTCTDPGPTLSRTCTDPGPTLSRTCPSPSASWCCGDPGPTLSHNCPGPGLPTTSVRCPGPGLPTTSVRCPGPTLSHNCPGPGLPTTSVRCPGPTLSVRCPGPTLSVRCPGPTLSHNCPDPFDFNSGFDGPTYFNTGDYNPYY